MTGPRVTLERPWLTMDLGRPLQVLSWALNRPGLVVAERIVWREVRNADLPEDFDVARWFDTVLAARGDAESVGLLTSRDVSRYRVARATADGVEAFAVATVGLSNAERIGQRRPQVAARAGTINVAVALSAGLSEAALLETVSIATQARTAAVMEAGLRLAGGVATGTGTDCLAVAAPSGNIRHAGLHTDVGEAVGRAVHDAVRAGAAEWMAELGHGTDGR
jgi:adenosylcobinamide amidohydrolase